VLALPREGGAKAEFLLETDASTSQVGFILMQRQIDGQVHPIGFWSRKLHAAGLDYSVRLWLLYGPSNCYSRTYRVILLTSNRTTVHAKPYCVKCRRTDVF
jgi:RNase H-like domain found in reverse transcriptase